MIRQLNILPHLNGRSKTKRVGNSTKDEQAQKNLLNIFDDMATGCQIISYDYRYLYVNKAVAGQGHSTQAKLLGRTMMEMYPGIDKTPFFGRLQVCLEQRQRQVMENEFTYPDGAKGWFELQMEPVEEGALIFSVDITQRKANQDLISQRSQQLEELTRQLTAANSKIETQKVRAEAMLASIGDGLIATDNDGHIILMNKSAEDLLHFGAEQAMGKNFFDVWALQTAGGQEVPFDKRPIHQALSSGKVVNANTYYFVRHDQTKFPVAWTVTPVIMEGRVIGAIGVFRDITKERAIERAKSEFVSLASHQLRTPLSAINWYSEMLLDEDAGLLNAKQKEYISEVYDSNHRMIALVNSLLNVSRIELGKLEVKPQKLDLNKICREVTNDLTADIKQKKIALNVGCDSKLPAITADPTYMAMIFQNLLSNAIRYTPSGGQIDLGVQAQNQSILITVKDTGYGIPKADQPKIFTKLYRASNALAKETNGNGLGLYLVKAIVEQTAGGRVWFKSEENQGTQFYVRLPIKRSPTRQPAAVSQ